MAKLPKEILVYQCDTVDGVPLYAIARNVEDIPEEFDGETVSVFTMNKSYKFTIHRSLK